MIRSTPTATGNGRRYAAFVPALLLSACAVNPDAYRLNPGAYQDNYIKLIDESATFLEHPTGVFPAKPPPTRLASRYRPEVEDTDNMDHKTLALLEQGYVMIGYAAVNTRETGEKSCDKGTLTKAEYDSCRFWTHVSGVNPDADPLGDPLDAAIVLNASLVVLQRGYSFSRNEIQARRIVTGEGVDVARTSGGSSFNSNTSHLGTSTTQGFANTTGTHKSSTVGGSAGYGIFGPTADVSGSHTWGDSEDNTVHGSETVDRSNTNTAGGDSHSSRTQNRSQHWATALVESAVDHYDYVATFWKRVKPQNLILGAFTDPLPRELWPLIGSRSARVVRAVVGDSPAYRAEMWEGDILVAIDDEKIQGEQGLQDALNRHAGQNVVFTIFRNDDFYELPVSLNLGTALSSR
jgi:hypothetical protein